MKTKRLLSLLVAMTMVVSLLGAFTITTEAASMTDATFFAKLNYGAYPALSAVKAAVDKGDYTTAKKELLKYYKERRQTTELGFGISEADENYGMAVLPMRNILTGPYEFDMWQAEFTVTSNSYETYEIDVTDRVAQELGNGNVSFMLFAGDKQQYPVLVQSKEAGADVAPTLVIEYERKGVPGTATVAANNDTYISSQNTGTTYGGEKELYIKEDGSGRNATGTNTRRTYINFPLGEAANSTVKSAMLIVSAKYSDDCTTGDKDVLVINAGDTTWSETSLKWSGISHSIYSYQDAANPTWNAGAAGRDNEYDNVTSRFWFGRAMAWEYLSYLENPEKYDATHPYAKTYPGKEFGPKLVELMNAFATQMNYGYTRTLETGERLNRWVDIVDAFLATDVFDGREDMFVNILSFMWGDCNYLNGLAIEGNAWWSNWRIVANAGFFKATEFLYELNDHDKFRNKVEANVEWTLNDLYYDDMSFKEAGPSYGLWCAQLFGDCAIAADKAGNPMSSTFIEKLRYATRDAMNSFYPDGYDSNVGDSNYRSKLAEFKRLADFLNDPVLTAYVNGDGSYTEGLTSFSDTVNSAYMRTSWDPQETTYLSFVNNPNDGHYHPDSNQVLMYAYGQPLLVDSGRYSYSSTNKIYDELRWARAHNTVEAEGVSMGTHANSAEKFSVWADNALFNFGTSGQHGYSGITHTRNVLFLKDEGFAVVTDYVDGNNANQKYNQNWHFLPSSNAKADGQNITTDFYGKANVILANADADAKASVEDGYFSADYGLVAASKYGSFSKTGADVKFGTVLYPVKAGESAAVTAKDIAADINSSAIEFTVDGKKSTLYVKNTDSATGEFGAYKTDAKMAYVNDNTAALVNGTTITGGAVEIKSPLPISDIYVSVDGDTLIVSGDNLMATTDETVAAAIKADGVTTVILNGEEVDDMATNADGILAVGVASVVKTETIEIEALKDGFINHNNENEGVKDRDIIQAAISGWSARNAYMGFDLTGYTADDFDTAVLRMTMVAPGGDADMAAAGNMHLYFLNYNDPAWDRDSLTNFVLDSSKMPTRTNTNAGGFTGYSYRTQGSAANVNAVGAVFEVDYTNNLKGYLSTGGNPQFTLAMISESGSRKFASINNDTYPGPTFVLTTKKVEGETTVTTVKVSFVNEDGEELQSPVTIDSGLKAGTLYTYDKAPEFITADDGTVYVLDSQKSSLGVMITEGKEHELTAVYTPAAEVKIQFTYGGEPVANGESAYVKPGSSYTFTPDMLYIFDGNAYLSDAERSTLTVKAGNDTENVITVVLIPATIGENVITNGDFTNGTTDWTDAATGAQYGGTVSGNYVHGDGQSLTNTASAGGSAVSTVRRFVPVKAGKTYYLSFYTYNTGAALGTGNNGLMSAFVPVTGTAFGNFNGITFKDYVEYGGQNSWSPESQSEVKRDRADMPYDSGMNHKEFLITIPEGADNIMISMFAWTEPGRLYFSDFEMFEIESSVVTINVPVQYVNEAGKEILPAKSFSARVGDEYNANSYVINGPIYGNKKIRTFNAALSSALTGTVKEDTVIKLVYSEEDYDGIILDLSFDDEETGFAGGLGKATSAGANVLVEGVKGNALSLDGTSANWLSAVMAEDGSPLLSNLEEITITFYTNKPSGTGNNNWAFFAAPNASAQSYQNEHYLGAADRGTNVEIERYNNSGARPGNNIYVDGLTADTWRLVTVVVRNTGTDLYLDGKLVQSKDSTYKLTDILGSKSVFQIGKANWDSGEFYNGLIDEFRIYDRALTAEEINALAVGAPEVSLGWNGEDFTIDFLFGGDSVVVYRADGESFSADIADDEEGVAFYTKDTNARYQAKGVVDGVETEATAVVSVYSLVTKAIADFAEEHGTETLITDDQLTKAIEVLNNGGIYLIGGDLTDEAKLLMDIDTDGSDVVITINDAVAGTGIKFSQDGFKGFASDKDGNIMTEFEVSNDGKTITLKNAASIMEEMVIYLEDVEFVLEIGVGSAADETVSGELDFVEEV